MVNVIPWQDSMKHSLSAACICCPKVEFFDPEDGQHWEGGPIITHNAQDGREVFEHFGFSSGKKWISLRS